VQYFSHPWDNINRVLYINPTPIMNGPGFLAVAIQPGPNTDETAFHEWYNTEHGPLRLRLPFISTGDRD
jgi:hypothetical protein